MYSTVHDCTPRDFKPEWYREAPLYMYMYMARRELIENFRRKMRLQVREIPVYLKPFHHYSMGPFNDNFTSTIPFPRNFTNLV